MQIGNSMIENEPFGGMNSTTILNKGKHSSKKSGKPRKSGNYSSGGTRAGTTGSGPAGQKRKTSANSSKLASTEAFFLLGLVVGALTGRMLDFF